MTCPSAKGAAWLAIALLVGCNDGAPHTADPLVTPAESFHGLDCVACHGDDYAATTHPDHQASGIPTTCAECHDTVAWQPAKFGGHETWPLEGRHQETPCASCHVNDVYAGTPRVCVDCHLSAFEGATNPNHAGFPRDCASCHTPAGWRPAQFPDHDAFWPLTGAHAQAECASCHVDAIYTGTPTTCSGCHQVDYNTTTNPKHDSYQIPTTCNDCHTTVAWQPADFATHETFFPIATSGKHTNIGCADCHTTASDWSVFACIPCHTKADMDDKHKDMPLYWSGINTLGPSGTCMQCHPDGTKN